MSAIGETSQVSGGRRGRPPGTGGWRGLWPRLRQRLAPYLLGLPGGVWLAIFFVVPLVAVLSVALQTGNPDTGYTLTWHFREFWDVISGYHTELLRSFEYGAISTIVALIIAYPMSYWIAFHGGRHKSTDLFLILRPFFLAVPQEVEEAGVVDGASRWLTFWRIVLPITLNGIATASTIIFFIAWGEFLYAITFLSDAAQYPISVLIAGQVGQYGIQWSNMMAIAVVASLPILVIYGFTHRRLRDGLALGPVR